MFCGISLPDLPEDVPGLIRFSLHDGVQKPPLVIFFIIDALRQKEGHLFIHFLVLDIIPEYDPVAQRVIRFLIRCM